MVKILSASLLGAALVGCGTVTETVYVQGLDATGNLPSAPLSVTDSVTAGQFQLSPRVSGLAANDGLVTGSIPIPGPRFPDSSYQSPARSFSRRFDAGVHGQRRHFVVRSVVMIRTDPIFGFPSETVGYFIDELDETNVDLYAAPTFNSRTGSWPVNVFLQGAYNRCTLASFEPKHGVYPLLFGTYRYEAVNADYRVAVWCVTQGLCFRLGEVVGILAGAPSMVTDLNGASRASFGTPFVQVDFTAM